MNKKGFTIIELLLYIGMLAGFILVLGQLFFSILDSQLESQANSAVDTEGQYLLTRLSYDIRRAASLTTPAALGQTAATLVLDIGGTAHTYSLNGSNLTLTVSGNTYLLNSQTVSVTGFSVQRLGNPAPAKPSVLVDLDITSETVSLHQQSKTRSYQISVNLP